MSILTTFGAFAATLNMGKYMINVPGYLLIIVVAVFAFGVTYVVIPSIVGFSQTKNLFDKPDSRKSHSSAIPTLGGAAVFLGMILPTTLVGDLGFDHDFKYILAGLLVLFYTGIKDDILIISARTKLVSELLAIVLVVILGDIRVTNFHGFFSIFELPYVISILFTTFMFVVVINGFNLIDGIDGLASGVGIISLSGLGTWFLIAGDIAYAAFCFSTVAALAAFFRFNVFSKANRIFLGDTGSLIIGMVVTIFVVRFLEGSLVHPLASMIVSAPAIAIGLLIVPLIDTLRVFTLRVMSGKSPFKPDRLHLHHKLLELGLNHRHSTFMILGFNLVIIGLALALRQMGNIRMLAIILPTALLITSVPGLIFRYRRRDEVLVIRTLGLFNSLNRTRWVLPDSIINFGYDRQVRKGRFTIHPPVPKGFEAALGGVQFDIINDNDLVDELEIEEYPD